MPDLQEAREELMLTTSDNPYNPFEQFDQWYSFDTQKGYNTSSYLARIAKLGNELSEQEEHDELTRAMKEIFRMNLTGNYVLVTAENVQEFLNRKQKQKLSPTGGS